MRYEMRPLLLALIMAQDPTFVLTKAMSHLEKNVILPMDELSQRLNFRLELTKEILNTQVRILEGDSSRGWKGLLGEIMAAEERQLKQQRRVKKLIETFERQRELAACILTQSLALKSKVNLFTVTRISSE